MDLKLISTFFSQEQFFINTFILIHNQRAAFLIMRSERNEVCLNIMANELPHLNIGLFALTLHQQAFGLV